MTIEQKTYRELGFNEYFIEHLANPEPSHTLGYRCEQPNYVYNSPLADRNIFPLWECGTTAVYFNKNTNKYEVCSLEDIDDVWVSYSSVQGILAYLLLQLWEDEHTSQEIEEISTRLGFKYTKQLLEEAEKTKDYSAWREVFPYECR